MTASAVRRIALLAAVGVLAVAIALYASHRNGNSALPPGAGPWHTALAGAYSPPARTDCGVAVGPNTAGVGHPVLPCGVELYVRYGNTTVLTRVVDRGHVGASRDLDLTPELASLLGVTGTQPVEWRFVR
ncbi:MAG TPA: hypothetical protein VLW05_07935 [Gaiellaceae bacterium]|nr:hypothetical protein [Gaiellaceae bacterium]